mgnify:CR=1 FL=1
MKERNAFEQQLMREGGVPIEPKADWREAVEIMDRVTEYWKEHYPFKQEAIITPQAEYSNKPHLIYFDSDWHLGAIGFAGGRFKEDIELLEKTPNSFLITNGDDIDIGMFKDLAHLQALPKFSQAMALVDLAEELTFRNPRQRQIWLAAVGGNHTFTVFERSGMLYEGFLRNTNLVLFPGLGKIHLKIGGEEYKIAMAHKHTGRSKLNVTLASKRLMEYYWPDADVSITGHYHEKAWEKLRRGDKERLAIALGTRRTEEQLFELSRGYGNPSEGGLPVVFWPDQHKFMAFDLLQDAVDYIK